MDMETQTRLTQTPARKILAEGKPRSDNLSPIVIASREEKLKSVSDAIDSLVVSKKADNLFIYGKSGSGKSTYIQHLLSNMQNTGSVIPVYINCHEHSTKMAIYHKITQQMDSSFSRRGFAGYEVFERIKELIHTENKSILLILDDVEALPKDEAANIFYPIIEENGAMKSSFGIIIISDSSRAFERLDPKIRSSFMFRIIEFESYTKEEIKQILQSVAKKALAENTYDEMVIDNISELAESSEGNARFAIWLLFNSAKNAEQRDADKIELGDVKAVYERILPFSSSDGFGDSEFSAGEQLILNILKTGEKSSSEIYEIFLKKTGKSKRQVRNYLTSLIKRGHVESESVEGGGSSLKPRIFRLKKEVETCL